MGTKQDTRLDYNVTNCVFEPLQVRKLHCKGKDDMKKSAGGAGLSDFTCAGGTPEIKQQCII